MSRVAVFDLDGTLIDGDSYVAFLLGFLRRRPSRLISSLRLPLATVGYFAGVRDNAWLKSTYLSAVMGGVSRGEIDSWSDRFVEILKEKLRPRAVNRIAEHVNRGDRVLLATASLDVYVEKLAHALGIEDVICTRVEWDADDRLTGALLGENCYGLEKLRRVQHHLSGGVVDAVYSDDVADLPLLSHAQQPVAVNPTRRLAREASIRGFRIEDWAAKTRHD